MSSTITPIGSDLPRHVEEYEAETYAFDTLRRHGVKVPRDLIKQRKLCMVGSVKQAGPKAKIDPSVKKWIGPKGMAYVKLRWQGIHSPAAYDAI